jgi:signal transduction histidine kinase/ActR/RegA family two-component response regulator
VSAVLPALGDFGFLDLVEDDGEVRRIARAYEDPGRQAILSASRWVRSERADMNLCALSSGKPALHADVDDVWLRQVATSPEHLAVMRDLGFCSMITVPAQIRGRVIGALTLFYADSRRQYDQMDFELAREIARRAAFALENARLYRNLQDSERRMQAAVVEAREASRRKDEFLAMLGHELRNPLAPIVTALELMKLRGDASFVRERGIIDRHVRDLLRLVDDLLDVSRITRGMVELRRAPIELAVVVARAAESTSPLFEARQHRVSFDVPSTGLVVLADEQRLAQVVANLLSNAAKYSDPGARIDVSARRSDGDVVLVVRDTGVGIAPELLPRVFEMFVQGERTMDRSQGGLGLGLSLVRSLVTLHGGTVRAESAGAGQGSTFTVRLPACAEISSARAPTPPPVARVAALAPARRVLVVDDNRDAAELLAQALAVYGFEVRVAYDGPEGIALAERFVPDVAIVDVGLPVMDGYEVGTRLRELLGARCPVLMALTGYGQPDDRARALAHGFAHHLVKPVDAARVAELVATAQTSRS